LIPGKKGRAGAGSGERHGWTLRFFAGGLLLSLLVCEIYCIILLRESFSVRSDQLSRISMQLQSLKKERSELQKEMSSIKYAARKDADGNPSVR
jgi:hypothetical protein